MLPGALFVARQVRPGAGSYKTPRRSDELEAGGKPIRRLLAAVAHRRRAGTPTPTPSRPATERSG